MTAEMGNLLLNLGVGGVLVLLILDRVFAFLKQRKNGPNHRAGGQTTEFWRATNKGLIDEGITTLVLPVLKQQTEILKEFQALSARQFELILKQGFVLDAVKVDLEHLRASNHTIVQAVQRLSIDRRSVRTDVSGE